MSAVEGRKIVVVGGGPAGLTLARLLQMQGADVAVYERDTDRHARLTGSALDLHAESGLAALEAAGLMEGFWARYRPELNRLRLADNHANVLYDFDRGQGSGIGRPEIERAPLRDLLLDSLRADTVRWNRKLVSATDDGQRVTLQFDGGESVLADLVVGADGANSKLRALVTPVRPEYVGVTVIEGFVPAAATAVPEIWPMLGGAALMALGAEQTLGMATKSDGSILFYAGLRASEARIRESIVAVANSQQQVAWFRSNFSQWSARWEPLFAHANALIARPLYSCPVRQQWNANPRMTLLGDAAHVMPPYAGEGVNMAMLDALVLSRELRTKADTGAAIEAYQREMFARMAAVAEDTLANTETFYAPDAAAQIVAMFQRFASTGAAAAAVAVLTDSGAQHPICS